MNYSEVRELLQAGFTADEIRGFMNNPQNPQNNPQSEKTEQYVSGIEKSTEKTAESVSAQVQDPADQLAKKEENPNNPDFNALNETMNKLIRTIQSYNLHNNSVQTTSAPDIDKQVDSIMSSIIRPEHKKGD